MKYFHEIYTDCPSTSSPRRIANRNKTTAKVIDLTSPTDVPDVKFDDFSYWKPVIPVLLDAEIAAVLNNSLEYEQAKAEPETDKRRQWFDENSTKSSAEAEVNAAFNEFNFWRVPVMEINDLMASIKL